MQCPKCGSTDQITCEGGYLCLDCRHEHDGTQPPPVDAETNTEQPSPHPTDDGVGVILSATTVAEVLAPPEDNAGDAPLAAVSDGGAGTPNLAGRFVALPQFPELVLCTVDDGADTIVVGDVNGGEHVVQRSSVTYVDDDGGDPLAPVVGATTVSEDQPFSPTIFAVASLAITMGLACIGDDGETLYNPRIGWLPPPCNEVPEAEQGVAYAIALLVRTFGLDRSSVEQIAATLMQGAAVPGMETTQ